MTVCFHHFKNCQLQPQLGGLVAETHYSQYCCSQCHLSSYLTTEDLKIRQFFTKRVKTLHNLGNSHVLAYRYVFPRCTLEQGSSSIYQLWCGSCGGSIICSKVLLSIHRKNEVCSPPFSDTIQKHNG